MVCEVFIHPDWSPPNDPARPCRPKAGYGLLMMMMKCYLKLYRKVFFAQGCWSHAMFCGILLPLLVLAESTLQAVPRPIKIAAIFDEDTNMRHDLMFVNSVKSVNKLRGLLRGVTLVKASFNILLSPA